MNPGRTLSEVRDNTRKIVVDFLSFAEESYEAYLDWRTMAALHEVKHFVAANAEMPAMHSFPIPLLVAEVSVAESVHEYLSRYPRLGFSSSGSICALRYMLRRELAEKKSNAQLFHNNGGAQTSPGLRLSIALDFITAAGLMDVEVG